MKKVLKKLKNIDYLIFTFIISIIIICIIYKLQDVTPLGKNSLLKIDFFHQYGPMLSEFFDRIKQGENLIYTFNTGLGLPFFRNFFNYMSSPINIIILLFKRENLLLSFSVIIAIKAALSACTMTYYLKKKLNLNKYIVISLGLLYAFSAYFSAYYWNIMWTDGMIYLPLVALGIENIINKNNGILYTISLSLMLYTNYFIGYMICIFSVIYFISYLIIKKIKTKKLLKPCIKFFICSLTAGLFMAWALIPMFEALMSTDAVTGTMPTSQYYSFTIIEFIQNHITGVVPTVLASDITNSPNVSCGILGVALYLLFIFNNKIKIRKKIVYSALLLLFLASFYIAPLDYIWHAFHVPNDLPYRYSFIYTFILITIGAYSLKYIKNISFTETTITYVICILYLTIIKKSNFENISDSMLKINYILITIYYLIYCLYNFFSKYKKLIITIFILVISIECIISINNKWEILQYVDDFYSPYETINNIVKKINNEDNEAFYRIEKDNILTLNDGAWYDYYGLSMFSSMGYNALANLNYNLGQPGNNINSYYYKPNTPIYDLMFDIKYIIGNIKDSNLYNEILNENDTKTYKFNYTNGLMFGVNSNIKNWKYMYNNPFEFQNEFIENTVSIKNTLYRITLINKEIIKETTEETIVNFKYNNESNNFYVYANNSLINYIYIENKLYYSENTDLNTIPENIKDNIYEYILYDEQFIINEKCNSEYINITVSFSTYLNEEVDIYTLNTEKFLKAYNYYNKYKVNITDFKEHYIKGNINTDKKLSIYTSIPYDSGWKVFVNNKQVNTYKINDSLLGFDINKGENNIILKYAQNNIDIGLSISITTLIISITYIIIKKKTN